MELSRIIKNQKDLDLLTIGVHKWNEYFRAYLCSLNDDINIEPPKENEKTYVVSIPLRYDIHCMETLWLLRKHTIFNYHISPHWKTPEFQVRVSAKNIELLKQTGCYFHNKIPFYGWSDYCEVQSENYFTWKYVYDNHIYLMMRRVREKFVNQEFIYFGKPDRSAIDNEWRDFFKNVDEYKTWTFRFRNNLKLQSKKNTITFQNYSEAMLFFIVQLFFEDAIFQYRDKRLKRQSLDIFLPSCNFAIEYQGIQHYKSMGHYGGEKGLKENKNRDEKKRELCEELGICLYDWDYMEQIEYSKIVRLFVSQFGHDESYYYKLSNDRMNCWKGKSVNEYLIYAQKQCGKKTVREYQGRPIASGVIAYRQYDSEGTYIDQYDNIFGPVAMGKVSIEEIDKACVDMSIKAGGYFWRKVSAEEPKNNLCMDNTTEGHDRNEIISQIDRDGVLVRQYESIGSASGISGVSRKSIEDVLNGLRKEAGGYFWIIG